MVSDLDRLLADEERLIRALRRVMDIGVFALRWAPLTRDEAEDVAAHVRTVALGLFPDKGEVFDLVCAPRLRRAIDERFATG